MDRLAKVELPPSHQTDEDPMTEDRLPLAELMAKAGDGEMATSCALWVSESPRPHSGLVLV